MKCFLALVFLILSSCGHVNVASPVIFVNSDWAMAQPYVILVSIDGYRFDYNQLFHPPSLLKFEKEGVSSDSLIPIYPSKTFASHYSMITGLTADHSGIVANEFYDPDRKKFFSAGRDQDKFDGSWYGGHPIWELAAHQKMLSASYFWVGSEALINHVQPNYWVKYNESISNHERVEQILTWLKLPERQRPHFLTLYFSAVDTAGHRFGAGSDQVGQEVLKVDESFGQLMAGVEALNAQGLRVSVIVVSDHGMENVNPNPEYLDDEADLSHFLIAGHGPEMKLYLKENEDLGLLELTQKKLREHAKHYKVYRRNEVPSELHYRDSNRVGDLVIVAEAPYLVETHSLFRMVSKGNHGWNARKFENLRGVFYAGGPAFKKSLNIRAFENFNIYSVITHILSLDDMARVDSSIKPVETIFSP
jgi:predicted AlkP superfamily pyrophosphatase or phosphodiesterase